VLLCLAFLAAASALVLLRLLPMSGRDRDIEILVPRYLLLVLQCQVGRPVFADTDRAVLAGRSTTSRQGDCGASCCWYAPTPSCGGTACRRRVNRDPLTADQN
jgi:hypothetical protein